MPRAAAAASHAVAMACHAMPAVLLTVTQCHARGVPLPRLACQIFLNLPVSDPAIYMPDCACSDPFPLLLLHQRP